MPFKFNYLIIGHGLAGAILSVKLLARGKTVCVIDQPSANTASKVAAGIINPITGHRLNVSRGFDDFFRIADGFYRELQQSYKVDVYSPLKQIRLIKNAGQFEYYQRRVLEKEYQDLLGHYSVENQYFSNRFFGAVEIASSAVLDTKLMLDRNRDLLRQRQSYRAHKIDYDDLEICNTEVKFKDIRAECIVFCEGYQAIDNPWLQNLPFKLSKGEILNIDSDIDCSHYLNWGHWLVPQANRGEYRLGSSYIWNDLTFEPVQFEKITGSFEKYTGHQAQVNSIEVGIRPTTKYRTPFIGRVTGFQNGYCFNGFGSKGCLIIPQYADQLCDYLLDGKPLAKELSQWL